MGKATHRPPVVRAGVEMTASASGVFSLRLPDERGVLIAIATVPLDPMPSDFFDVRVLSPDGADLLLGFGMRRSPTVETRSIVRLPKKHRDTVDRHPRVSFKGCILLATNLTVGAKVRMDFYLGQDVH